MVYRGNGAAAPAGSVARSVKCAGPAKKLLLGSTALIGLAIASPAMAQVSGSGTGDDQTGAGGGYSRTGTTSAGVTVTNLTINNTTGAPTADGYRQESAAGESVVLYTAGTNSLATTQFGGAGLHMTTTSGGNLTWAIGQFDTSSVTDLTGSRGGYFESAGFINIVDFGTVSSLRNITANGSAAAGLFASAATSVNLALKAPTITGFITGIDAAGPAGVAVTTTGGSINASTFGINAISSAASATINSQSAIVAPVGINASVATGATISTMGTGTIDAQASGNGTGIALSTVGTGLIDVSVGAAIGSATPFDDGVSIMTVNPSTAYVNFKNTAAISAATGSTTNYGVFVSTYNSYANRGTIDIGANVTGGSGVITSGGLYDFIVRSGATITAGAVNGVGITSGNLTSTLDNAGTIQATAAGGIGANIGGIQSINNSGTISGAAQAILLNNSTSITNSGTLQGGTGGGIEGAGVTVNNNGGTITGRWAIYSYAGNPNTITNTGGTLTGAIDGINIGPSAGLLTLNNSGTINTGGGGTSAAGVYLNRSSDVGTNSITNSGTITGGVDATFGYAVSIDNGALTVNNNNGGQINSLSGTAGGNAIRLSTADAVTLNLNSGSAVNGRVFSEDAGARTVLIAGTLTGAYDASSGTGVDTVTLANTGAIGGAVTLGAGADTFTTLGGSLGSTVDGGGDSDTYVVDFAFASAASFDISRLTSIETFTHKNGNLTLTGSFAGTGITQIYAGTGTPAGTLTFSGSGLAAPISVNGAVIRAEVAGGFGTGTITTLDPTIQYGATGTYSNNIVLNSASPLADPTRIQADAGVTATLTGTISQAATSQPLTFDGLGTVVLTGGQTYTGGTTISSGRVIERDPAYGGGTVGRLVAPGAVSIASGAVLEYNLTVAGIGDPAGLGRWFQDNVVVTGAGTIEKTGSRTLAWRSNMQQSAGGLLRVSAGQFSGSSDTLAVWTNNQGNLEVVTGATFDTVEGEVRVGALSGGGTVNVSYDATRGSLTFGVAGASGTFSGTIQSTSTAGRLNKVGAGTQTLTGANIHTGATTISGGTLALSGTGTLSSSAITNNATFDISGHTGGASILNMTGSGATALGANTLTVTNASGTYSGSIGGTGSLVKQGGGTWVLAGTHGYTGTTTVSGGTLQLGNGGAGVTMSSSGVTLSGGSLAFNQSASSTFAPSVSGNGGITVTGLVSGGVSNGNTLTFSGALTNNGALSILDASRVTIAATGSINTSAVAAVNFASGSTLTNLGSIAAAGGGVPGALSITAGGTVVNGAIGNTGATINGSYSSIYATGGLLDVTNYGVVTTGGYGIVAQGGGGGNPARLTLVNNGAVVGAANAVVINETSTTSSITNSGLIATGTYSGAYGSGTLTRAGAGDAIFLRGTTTLTNNAGGVISGSYANTVAALDYGNNAVTSFGALTVSNSGKILGVAEGSASSNRNNGVFIQGNAGLTNTGTRTSGTLTDGIITGGWVGAYLTGNTVATTVTNTGLIQGNRFAGIATLGTGGGTINNNAGGEIRTSGFGGAGGILIDQGNWTVNNAAGALIANSATLGVSGTSAGLYARRASGGNLTVNNSGTIEQTGATGGFGIRVENAGSSQITNNLGGIIRQTNSAGAAGISTTAGVTIANGGTISTASSGAYDGVTALGDLTLTNTGTSAGGVFTGGVISAANASGVAYTGTGAITNSGWIAGGSDAQYGYGVQAATGSTGTVTNQAGGLIEGGVGGILLTGSSLTVGNSGTIRGNNVGSSAIRQTAGALTVTNDATGVLSGVRGGVFADTSATSVDVTNAGAISSTNFFGVEVRTGTLALTNQANGTISGVGGVIFSGSTGTINNNANASITGGATNNAVYSNGTDLTVNNAGTISVSGAAYAAIFSEPNRRVALDNSGTITGGYGVSVGAASSVTNSGAITATANLGVALTAGGTVTNEAAGTITALGAGNGFGIGLFGASTVVNNGRIEATFGAISTDNTDHVDQVTLGAASTTIGSITLGGADDSLTINLGASMNSAIRGGTGTDTLVAQGPGSTTLGGNISGFETLTKNGTGTLTLTGANVEFVTVGINGGRLSLSEGAAINDTAAVSVDGILGLNANETIGSLSGSGNVELGANTLSLGADNGSTTFSGILSGTGGLTKIGTGTLTLSGANVYTGATTIDGGTLRLGAAGVLSDSTVLTINVGGTLDLNGFDEIVGSFALYGTLTGGGTLSANAANLYGGTLGMALVGTTVNQMSGTTSVTGTIDATNLVVVGGTLQLAASNRIADTAALTINSGGALDLQGFDETVASATLAGTLNGTGTLTAATYALQGATVNANLGAGTLTQSSGASTLIGTSAAETVNVDGGTLTLGASDRLTGVTALNIALSATLDTGAFSQSLNGAVDNSGTIAGALNLSGGSLNNNAGGTITAALGVNGAVTLTNAANGSISGDIAMSAGTLMLDNAGTVGLVRGSGTLALTNRAGATISGASDIVYVAGDLTVVNAGTIRATNDHSALASAGGANLAVTNAATGVITGGIDNGGAFDVAIQLGSSTNTIENYGTMQGARGGTTATDGVALFTTNNGVSTITLHAGSVTGGVLTGSADDTLTLYSSEDNALAVIGGGGVLLRGAGSHAAASVGAVDLGDGADTVNLRGSGSGSISSSLAGVEVLNKLDTGDWSAANLSVVTVNVGTGAGSGGTLTLSGTGSITDINVNGAALTLASTGAAGNATIHMIDPTLNFAATGTYSNPIDLAVAANQAADPTLLNNQSGGAITLAGAITESVAGQYVTFAGAGSTRLAVANNWTGGTTIASGTIILGNVGAMAASQSVTLANAGAALTVNTASRATVRNLSGVAGTQLQLATGGLDVIQSTDTVFDGVISGGGAIGIDKSGTGKWTLTAVNTLTSGIGVNAGTLALAGDGSLASAFGLYLNLAGANFDIAAINASSTSLVQLVGAAGSTIALGAKDLRVGYGTFAGSIGGTGGLTKVSGGTLTLSGANTYSGATSVTAGTLQLGASGAIADTSVLTVAAGATFGLATFNDTVATAILNGTLAGTGTLTAGEYRLTGATVNGNLGAGTLLQLGGTSVLNGTAAADAVTIAGGTLLLGASDRLANSAIVSVANGATLGLGANSDTVEAIGLAGTLAGSGTLTANEYQLTGATVNANLGTGNLFQLGGTSVLNGTASAANVTVQGGTLALGAADRMADDAALLVASGAALDLGAFNDTVGVAALAGTLAGTGTLTAGEYQLTGAAVDANLGAGSLLQLGGTSVLTGTAAAANVAVQGGSLALGAPDRLADTAAVAVSAGATFDLGAFDETVGTAAIAGTLNGTGMLSANVIQLTGATVNANVAGTLINAGGVSTLIGAHAGGNVAINAGTLTLGSSNRLADAATVAVATGATLGLGANDETVALASIAGRLAGTGTLTAAEYQLAGGTIDANLAAGNLFNVSGASTLNGVAGAALVSVQGGTLRIGASERLNNAAALTIDTTASFDLAGFTESVGTIGNGATGGGTLALGAGRLILTGNGDSAFSGAITGSGSIDKQGTGRLTLAGTFATTGRVDLSAGTLAYLGSSQGSLRIQGGTLIGQGSFAGNVSLATGTLAPGGLPSGTTIQPIGSFEAGSLTVSGGSLLFDFGGSNFNFASDTIRVTGPVVLSGGTVNVNALSATNQYGFDNQYVIVQGASISGTFANGGSFANVASDPLLKWRLRYDLVPNAVVLQVQKGIDFVTGLPGGGTPNQNAVGEALNGGAGASTDQWSATLNTLVALTPAQRAVAYDSISGESIADASTAAFMGNNLFLDLLRQRTGEADELSGTGIAQSGLGDARVATRSLNSVASRLAAGRQAYGAEGNGERSGALWSQAFGGYQRLDGNTGQATVATSAAGVAVGGEGRIGDLLVGIAGGLTEIGMDVDARRANLEGRLYQVGGYASYDDGVTFATVAGDYYSGKFNSLRQLTLGAAVSSARGEFDTKGYALTASAGRRIDLGGGLRAIVSASATKSHDSREAFAESASGGLALQAAAADRDLFTATGDVKIGQWIRTGAGFAMPYASVGVRYNAGDLDTLGNMRFGGAPTGTGAFQVQGARIEPLVATYGGGIDVQASDTVSLGVAVENAYGDRTRESRASMRVKIGF